MNRGRASCAPPGRGPSALISGGCAARPTGYLHARLRRDRRPGRSTENSEEPLSQHPLVAAYLVKGGIHYEASLDLLVASQDLGMLNVAVRPRLLLLSLPLLIVTLGLFALFINAVLLYFVGWLLKPSFQPDFRNGITTKIAKNTKRRHLTRRGRGRNRPRGMLTKPLSLFAFSAFFVVNFGIRVQYQPQWK